MARRSPAPVTALALIERAARRFVRARLYFGHGTDNARDEAAFIVLHALGLPPAAGPDLLALPVSVVAAATAESLVQERIERRCPAAYLTQRMWFAGSEFYVDQRVLVPRSPLAELIQARFEPWLAPASVRRILDIGTGSGCIALAAALAFPAALVDATDLSPEALVVAARNRTRHGLDARVKLYEADLFPPTDARYDLIVSNPPYVPAARLDELPAEYRAEPRLALVAGADGFDCVERILRRACEFLTADGVLVMEVGEIWPAVDARYDKLPLTWIEFAGGGEGVFAISRRQLAAHL